MPLVYREAVPEDEPLGTVLCVHGYPESSYMWRHVLEAAAAAGWRAVAPDLPGYGDSPYTGPATWARHVEALDDFHRDTEPGMDDRAIREYFKAYSSDERRRGQLELYRSGEFSELAPYDLGTLDVPALVLWGADDPFAPIGGAHRFAKELPDAELVVLDTGHFVFDDAPDEAAAHVVRLLERV
jgi:pimeloyl-ACP methyl ester carboxylesterase